MEITQQEIEYARELAAIRRAKKGIGVSKDIGKSSYARNGGDPNGSVDPPQEETLPEEKQPEAAGQLREAVSEKAKEVAKEVAKKVAKKVVKKIVKKAILALIKNPYFWLAVAIALVLLMIYIVIFNLIVAPKSEVEEYIKGYPELQRAREEYRKEEEETSPSTWLFENEKIKVVVTIPYLSYYV